MRSFAHRLTKSLALFVTVAIFVTVAVAGLAPAAVDNGKDAQFFLAVSDDTVKPSDKAPTCAKPDAKPHVRPVGSEAYGRSYNEWSQDWWRWVFSIPTGINPILDTTGDSCAYGQDGPVWFLAGNFGGATTRSCSIGCNKAIFLPIINCEWENGWAGAPVLSIPDLRAICAYAGTPTTATLEVDGRVLDVRKNRVASDIFDYSLGPDNIGFQLPGVYFPAISDGIWAMLDPLPPGPHTVHFTASTSGGFALDVTYNLEVVGLELPCTSPSCP